MILNGQLDGISVNKKNVKIIDIHQENKKIAKIVADCIGFDISYDDSGDDLYRHEGKNIEANWLNLELNMQVNDGIYSLTTTAEQEVKEEIEKEYKVIRFTLNPGFCQVVWLVKPPTPKRKTRWDWILEEIELQENINE